MSSYVPARKHKYSIAQRIEGEGVPQMRWMLIWRTPLAFRNKFLQFSSAAPILPESQPDRRQWWWK